MAELLPALLPHDAQVFDVEPPAACPTCLSKVPQVRSEVVVRTGRSEFLADGIEVPVSLASITVTALPCGHVIYEQREAGGDE